MAITFIGSEIFVSVETPDAETAAGYSALAWTSIGRVISAGEIGDTSEDVNYDILKTGRKRHVNGIADIGEIPITVEFEQTDAGQVVVQDASGTNDTHSFYAEDEDGEIQYFQGVVANYRASERTASTYKGAMFSIRGQSAITTS